MMCYVKYVCYKICTWKRWHVNKKQISRVISHDQGAIQAPSKWKKEFSREEGSPSEPSQLQWLSLYMRVFIGSFSILRNSQLESDVCRLPYTWSLNSLLFRFDQAGPGRSVTRLAGSTFFFVITALFTNMRILKFESQLTIAFFAAVNHLNAPLRKQNFTLTGSKGHGLWFVDFDLFCVFLCFKVRCLWS